MAIRDLIEIGLDTVEGHTPQPTPSIQVQHALPLVPAPAPAPTVQRKTPSTPHAAPGLVQCTANPDHRPYSASAKECPMCANNKRARASKQRAKEKPTA